MYKHTCGHCKNTFSSAVTKSSFCSRQCLYDSMKKRVQLLCKICHKKFNRWPAQINSSPDRYCSQKCYWQSLIGGKHTDAHKRKIGKSHLGNKHWNWKGGRGKSGGYIYIYSPKHPFNSKRYVLEHRLVMEKHIGRYLNRCEIVHHINEIKTDNRLENLKLFPNSKAHIAYHQSLIHGCQ